MQPPEPGHTAPSLRELVLAFVLIALVISAEVALVAGPIVFTRPLWIDETMTQAIASSSSVISIINTLANGAETHLPGAFILMKWFAVPFGSVTPVSLRLFAFLS